MGCTSLFTALIIVLLASSCYGDLEKPQLADGEYLLVSCLGCPACTSRLLDNSARILSNNPKLIIITGSTCKMSPNIVQHVDSKRIIQNQPVEFFEGLGARTGNALISIQSGDVRQYAHITPLNLDSVLRGLIE